MEIIRIEIKDKSALTILQGLEKAKIIKLLKEAKKDETSPVDYKGVFSSEKAKELAQELNKSREEWEKRNI